MNNITDIFFDLDHTLWDFDKNSVAAFEKIFRTKHPTLDVNRFMDVYIPINQACWKLYQRDQMTHEELRYQRLKQSFEILKYTISDEEINQISYQYIEYLPDNNQLFEGAIEVLEYLAPKYNLHIITNGFAEVQDKKLKNSGIEDYFKTITNSEKAGVKKPHQNIFQYALSLANTHKNNSVMIGDCIEADFKGAINFGMKAILFDEKNIHEDATILKISHLKELKKLF